MSRSGYNDDCDGWELIRWRGAVASAIRGKRGQAFLKEMLAALDAMPEKKLIAHELVAESGEVCAMGAVALCRGMDVSTIDPDEPEDVSKAFGLSQALVREIADLNDESYNWTWMEDGRSKEERRWLKMREWCVAQIKQETNP